MKMINKRATFKYGGDHFIGTHVCQFNDTAKDISNYGLFRLDNGEEVIINIGLYSMEYLDDNVLPQEENIFIQRGKVRYV